MMCASAAVGRAEDPLEQTQKQYKKPGTASQVYDQCRSSNCGGGVGRSASTAGFLFQPRCSPDLLGGHIPGSRAILRRDHRSHRITVCVLASRFLYLFAFSCWWCSWSGIYDQQDSQANRQLLLPPVRPPPEPRSPPLLSPLPRPCMCITLCCEKAQIFASMSPGCAEIWSALAAT